ncbi:hypothetical protein [Lysobacter gummosus]|uniref:hypothetical protein n=1 Tax=Lysobacter gummosus TaxID=262324 RepID=UPI0036314F87
MRSCLAAMPLRFCFLRGRTTPPRNGFLRLLPLPCPATAVSGSSCTTQPLRSPATIS